MAEPGLGELEEVPPLLTGSSGEGRQSYALERLSMGAAACTGPCLPPLSAAASALVVACTSCPAGSGAEDFDDASSEYSGGPPHLFSESSGGGVPCPLISTRRRSARRTPASCVHCTPHYLAGNIKHAASLPAPCCRE